MKRILTFWAILVLDSMMNQISKKSKNVAPKNQESLLRKCETLVTHMDPKQLLWICSSSSSVESAVICGLLNSMLLKN